MKTIGFQELERIYGIRRCSSIVFVWVDEYSALFATLNALPLYGISLRLHMDHTELCINGEKAYFWGLKCPITVLIVGWHLSRSKEIVTDGEQSFPRAIWEVFDHSVKHYRYKGFVDKKNNNTIEMQKSQRKLRGLHYHANDKKMFSIQALGITEDAKLYKPKRTMNYSWVY